ncbi:MAG TPA: hypothetical protein VMW04_00760 [Patescibacteria group bacterium]|nr:hypothetical protein [Patescibacteria group bacterium]
MLSERENCRLKHPQRSTFTQLKALITDFNQLPLELQKEVEKQTREILANPSSRRSSSPPRNSR